MGEEMTELGKTEFESKEAEEKANLECKHYIHKCMVGHDEWHYYQTIVEAIKKLEFRANNSDIESWVEELANKLQRSIMTD
jgi:DNA topoisomerase VI subunit B